jgi:hypothetical protein
MKEATLTAQSSSMNVKVGIEQGAARMFVKAGGVLDIEPGGAFAPRAGDDRPRLEIMVRG